MKLLTKKEVAEYLNCSERTVDNYRHQGLLQCVKISARKIMFKLSSVENMIERIERNGI